MDSSTSAGGPHCDGLTAPSQYDIDSVEDAFKYGGLSDFTATRNNNTVTFTWKDNAWGEIKHDLRIMHTTNDVDESNYKSAIWKSYLFSTEKDWVGQHKDIAVGEYDEYIENYTSGKIALTEHITPGVRLPDDTAYRICGAAYFQQNQFSGPTACSDPVWVDNREHNAKIPTPTPTLTPTPTYTPTPTPTPSGSLTAPSKSMPVAGTLKVTVSNLQPNDHNKFTLNLTRPIVKRDPSKDDLGCGDRKTGGNDWVQTIASANETDIYACGAGTGNVALKLKSPVRDIATLSIAVVAPTPTPTATPTTPYLVASKTRVAVNERFSVTAHNVKVSNVRFTLTSPLEYAPEQEQQPSLCGGGGGIGSGINSIIVTQPVNGRVTGRFEGCSAGKGKVKLARGLNTLASIDITVSNTPATATPTPGSARTPTPTPTPTATPATTATPTPTPIPTPTPGTVPTHTPTTAPTRTPTTGPTATPTHTPTTGPHSNAYAHAES